MSPIVLTKIKRLCAPSPDDQCYSTESSNTSRIEGIYDERSGNVWFEIYDQHNRLRYTVNSRWVESIEYEEATNDDNV